MTAIERYHQEFESAFWAGKWRNVAARCRGILPDDPRFTRIQEHYFPLFDAAFKERDGRAWHAIERNFNVGTTIGEMK